MNTRQHCFTRMLVFAAAGLVCAAVWRPESAGWAGLLCLLVALTQAIMGLQVQE